MSDEELMERVMDIICATHRDIKLDAKFVFNQDTYNSLATQRDSDGIGFVKLHMPDYEPKLCGFSIEINSDYEFGEMSLVPANTIISNIDDKDFHNA